MQALNDAAYGLRSSYGLMVKTLFYTGARVAEFIHIRVDDLHLQDNPPQVHVAEPKRQSTRYVPVPPSLAHELRTHLGPRRVGFLFESNRHTRYSPRTIQSIVKQAALAAGSPSEFTRICCGTRSPHCCCNRARCRWTKSRSSSGTARLAPPRSTPRPACVPLVRTTSGRCSHFPTAVDGRGLGDRAAASSFAPVSAKGTGLPVPGEGPGSGRRHQDGNGPRNVQSARPIPTRRERAWG